MKLSVSIQTSKTTDKMLFLDTPSQIIPFYKTRYFMKLHLKVYFRSTPLVCLFGNRIVLPCSPVSRLLVRPWS